jgi:hypothetical protein
MVAREDFDSRILFVDPIPFGGQDLQTTFRNAVVWGLSDKAQKMVEDALDLLD